MPTTKTRDEFIRDIAITAVESGIGYWSSCKRYRWSTGVEPLLNNMLPFPDVRIVPAEDPADFNETTITRKTIETGLRRIRANECGKWGLADAIRKTVIAADVMNNAGDIDADAADAVVQIGLFGELMFS